MASTKAEILKLLRKRPDLYEMCAVDRIVYAWGIYDLTILTLPSQTFTVSEYPQNVRRWHVKEKDQHIHDFTDEEMLGFLLARANLPPNPAGEVDAGKGER